MVDAGAGHRQGMAQPHRVGVAEVEPAQPLGDHDGPAAVGGEVQVVGVGDRDRPADVAGGRVDRGEGVGLVVGDPEPAQVPGRGDVLGQAADPEPPHHPAGAGVDHVDGAVLAVRHPDPGWHVPDHRAEPARPVGGVDVAGAQGRWHAGKRGAADGAPGGWVAAAGLAVAPGRSGGGRHPASRTSANAASAHPPGVLIQAPAASARRLAGRRARRRRRRRPPRQRRRRPSGRGRPRAR